MAKAKQKFYVVWKGKTPGIYTNWDDCKAQVDGFTAAAYKAFPTQMEAELAFKDRFDKHVFKKEQAAARKDHKVAGGPIHESIVVDAAWNSVQKDMEYQGILYKTNTRIFHKGPFANGTNNIGEFLAIVHALGYCKKHGWETIPIYSDSRNAISWVKAKKCKTSLEVSAKTQVIHDLIARAEYWLQTNTYKNKILKWETAAWGENPADFGRK